MKKTTAILLTILLLLSCLPLTVFAAPRFCDVPQDCWYAEAVNDVATRGLMVGTSELTFCPNAPISEAMLATILFRLSGGQIIDRTTWYGDAMRWSAANDLTNFYDEPETTVTRGQMYFMLFRFAALSGLDVTGRKDISVFTDAATAEGSAAEALRWAYANALMSGRPDNLIAPRETATRAEAATVFSRFSTDFAPTAPTQTEPSGSDQTEPTTLSEPTHVTGSQSSETVPTPKENEETVSGGSLSLIDFDASEKDILLNVETVVLFRVLVEGDARNAAPEVYTTDGDRIVAMNDSGINGDSVPNDGIFSGQAMLHSEEIAVQTYVAKCAGEVSNTAEIGFYRELAQNDFVSFAALQSMLAEKSYEEAYRFLQTSDEVVEVLYADEESRTISYRTIYGITGVYEAQAKTGEFKGSGAFAVPVSLGIDYTLAGENLRTAEVKAAVQNPDVAVLRPYRTSEFQYEDFRDCGQFTADALGGRASVFDDEDVTLEVMKQLDTYGSVLIDSHGAYTDTPLILIGESLDRGRFLWDLEYYLRHSEYSADYCCGRIVCGFKYSRLAVSSRFFKKYYDSNSLKRSFWFLGTCHSLHNNDLAQTLFEKGADTIIGFDDSVTTGYCNKMLFETVANSMILSASTAQEGLTNAKKAYGAADNYGTECILFGLEDFRLVEEISVGHLGTLSGKVCKASDRQTPVGSATIIVRFDEETIYSGTVGADGAYSFRLPEGEYRLEISAPGYISFSTVASVEADGTTFTETFLMVEGSAEDSGIACGTIVDAVTGRGIDDVSVIARCGWNNTTEGPQMNAVIRTDASGRYTITLPLGNYTLELKCDGYVTTSVNVVVQSGTTDEQNGTMIPLASGDTFRIVLTWGEHPRDLDSHLSGKCADGLPFHVYFSAKHAYDGEKEICQLDIDDTDSYGPETVTMIADGSTPYYYYIHHYAGNGTLATSGAKVKVYQGQTLIAEYNVPTDGGTNIYWNVFAIVNGRLITRNTMTADPELSYIS